VLSVATDRCLATMRSLVYFPGRLSVIRFRYTCRHFSDLTSRLKGTFATEDGATGWGPDEKRNCW